MQSYKINEFVYHFDYSYRILNYFLIDIGYFLYVDWTSFGRSLEFFYAARDQKEKINFEGKNYTVKHKMFIGQHFNKVFL